MEPVDVVYGGVTNEPITPALEAMYKKTIAEMQGEVHALQMRIKALSEENHKLKTQLDIIVSSKVEQQF